MARKSSVARTPEEAEELLNNIRTFQTSAQSKQEEKISNILKLVSELFGKLRLEESVKITKSLYKYVSFFMT